VAVSGSHAYVADHFNLLVVDVSDSLNPRVAGGTGTPGIAYGVTISGNHAYVAAYESGLLAYDITNPVSPQFVGSVDTPQWAWDVTVSGNHAYVADGLSGLQVVDITNPASPRIVGSVGTPSFARNVAVAGGHAFVAASDFGLVVLPAQCGGPPTGIEEKYFAASGASLRVFPNPARSRSYISFETARSGRVRIEVFDVAGRRVRGLADERLGAGRHSFAWDGVDERGRPSASGVYLVRVFSDEGVMTARTARLR
jgi:uncharacterized secreted protein with C-terminal beta-propeller domain